MAKRRQHQSNGAKRSKKSKAGAHDGSENHVLFCDVKNLLKRFQSSATPESENLSPEKGDAKPSRVLPERFTEVEVEISELSSTGDGLGFAKTQDHVYVVPFTVPGDVVFAKTVNQYPIYTMTDLIGVKTPGGDRDDSLSKCPYFAKCAGCQLQMLPYSSQLEHKRSVVEKAYQNFSTLASEFVPRVAETIGSPLQYGYRTKLTPHFEGPPGAMSRAWRKDPSRRQTLTEVPAIGFQEKGRGKTIDIEDCPIGTDAVREGMKRERERIEKDFRNYSKGATILLRENTVRLQKVNAEASESALEGRNARNVPAKNAPEQDEDNHIGSVEDDTLQPLVETKTCITDSKAVSTEYIDSYVFKNTAGAFFQNNNAILPIFTTYIRDHIIQANSVHHPVNFLIDAYCGSGLFTVTLSTIFTSSLGIDISGESIKAAHENAALNRIKNAKFITADAAQLFKEVSFPSDETAVVVDPPRKGCDGAFLKQLLGFAPRRVIYVR